MWPLLASAKKRRFVAQFRAGVLKHVETPRRLLRYDLAIRAWFVLPERNVTAGPAGPLARRMWSFM